MKTIVAALLAAPAAALSLFDATIVSDPSAFAAHVNEYKLDFADAEDMAVRRAIFDTNAALVAQHNAENSDYKLAMNQFGHLTQNEFAERFLGLNLKTKEELANSTTTRVHKTLRGQASPDSVDWSTKGAVTDVKNQGSCGSCWSFSTTGSLEGAYFIKTGDLVSFSEQQLVSCDTATNQGCNGGLMDDAFDFIKENNGLCTEADYPYTGKDDRCSTSCTPVKGSAVASFVDVSPNPQVVAAKKEDLEAAVAQTPVSVAIAASGLAFQFYSSGVLTGRCTTRLDHGVLAVGYGTDGSNDYWKIKNSWGGSWGENGYVRIERGNSQTGGQCGVLMAPSYPVLA